jgi:hypothetical protein
VAYQVSVLQVVLAVQDSASAVWTSILAHEQNIKHSWLELRQASDFLFVPLVISTASQ